jgi:hypothetical protein
MAGFILTSLQAEKSQEERHQDYKIEQFFLPLLAFSKIPDKTYGEESYHQII